MFPMLDQRQVNIEERPSQMYQSASTVFGRETETGAADRFAGDFIPFRHEEAKKEERPKNQDELE